MVEEGEISTAQLELRCTRYRPSSQISQERVVTVYCDDEIFAIFVEALIGYSILK